MAKVLPWLVMCAMIVSAVALSLRHEAEPVDPELFFAELFFDQVFSSLAYPEFQPVVALVDGSPVSGERVQLGVAFRRASSRWSDPSPAIAVVDPRVTLDSLIFHEVMHQEAARRGLLCTDDERDEQARRQMALDSRPDVVRAEDADAYALAWANYLGVPLDDLVRHPDVVHLYERQCSMLKLGRDFYDSRGFGLGDPEGLALWGEYRDGLVAAAEVVILDPRLQ